MLRLLQVFISLRSLQCHLKRTFNKSVCFSLVNLPVVSLVYRDPVGELNMGRKKDFASCTMRRETGYPGISAGYTSTQCVEMEEVCLEISLNDPAVFCRIISP